MLAGGGSGCNDAAGISMVSYGDSMATVQLPPGCMSKSLSSFLDNCGQTPSTHTCYKHPCYWCLFSLKGVFGQRQCRSPPPPSPLPPDLHGPVNCPACGGDTFGPFVRPEPLRGCCCSSVRSATGPPGSLPSPSLVQLADSDGVVLMTHCFFARALSRRTVSCAHAPGMRGGGPCVKKKNNNKKNPFNCEF